MKREKRKRSRKKKWEGRKGQIRERHKKREGIEIGLTWKGEENRKYVREGKEYVIGKIYLVNRLCYNN